MASVIKMFSNFKNNHLHGGKRSPTPSTMAAPPGKDTPREDPEGAATNDIMNRRRVSISKSGRYKENHKRRSALLEDTKSDASSRPKDSDRQEVLVRHKDEKNKENEKNKLNSVRRESAISVTDGHAVADEIESLANTLTTENGAKTDLALT
ncbi:uncharacterized protein [Panulirus ornatus]|uniref:uncharacterized protein n=1 Tax=Panulirus ornatus TaxID=150431 RepID=UPI003A8C5A97